MDLARQLSTNPGLRAALESVREQAVRDSPPGAGP